MPAMIPAGACSEATALEQSFTVGPWHVDPLGNTLSRGGDTLRLEPKTMWVLVTLAKRAGDIVTRQELYEEVWRGRPVTDEVLSRCISLLRGALGDDPRAPAYIQTIPRVGYRLVAPVAWPCPDRGSSHEPPAPAARVPAVPVGRLGTAPGRWALLGLAVAAVAAGGLLAWRDGRRTEAVTSPPGMAGEVSADAIAVLPFENLGGKPGSEYFSDGLTDELITSLSRVQGLKVIARTTSFALKGDRRDARALGRALGVTKLVSGTVRVDGRRLRISAQLVDTTEGYELWSRAYDGSLDDVFEVQASIADAIVESVAPTLRTGSAPATAGTTRNADAHRLYLRALHVLKRRKEEPIRHAIGLLERAIELDAAYGAAYVELARAYALLPFYSDEPRARMFEHARGILATGVERGADVDPAAQSVRAFMAFSSWDWVAAEDSFRKAFAYNRNDPDLYQWYSQAQASLGHPERSLEFARRAWELDALSPVVNDRLAVAYLWTDQDERAAQMFAEAEVLGMGPDANEGSQVVLLLRRREFEAAETLIRSFTERRGGRTDWIGPFVAALEAGSGSVDIAAMLASSGMGDIEPRYLFGGLVLLGDFERALQVARRLAAEPSSLDVEFLFSRESAGLRRLPGFGELVESIGLDQHWDAYGWPASCRRDEGRIRCTS